MKVKHRIVFSHSHSERHMQRLVLFQQDQGPDSIVSLGCRGCCWYNRRPAVPRWAGHQRLSVSGPIKSLVMHGAVNRGGGSHNIHWSRLQSAIYAVNEFIVSNLMAYLHL